MTATIRRVKLARTPAERPVYRPGHWVVAGTPGTEPYPCTCRYEPCRYDKCPDRDRTEGDALPAGCCGRDPGRASGSHGGRTDRPGGHSNTRGARPSTWKPGENPRQGWERSVGPQHQAATVSEPIGGRVSVAGDLWAAPWDAEPAPWDLDDPALSGDGPDEGPGSHGETSEPGHGHSNGDAVVRQHSEGSDGLQRARARIRDAQCNCPTPWDPPPPVLLVAETKTGPVRTAVALDGPRAAIRELAWNLLRDQGWGLKTDWKDVRHTLLPPVGKLKTRPGFAAELCKPEEGGKTSAYAVIDTPPEDSPGVHCIDCHLSFSSNVAYQLHRPSWMQPCRKPETVLNVSNGAPLLVRGPGAVWASNKDAVYGPRGCPVGVAEIAQIYERGSRELKRWRYGKGQNRR